jgi:hypothetical protein
MLRLFSDTVTFGKFGIPDTNARCGFAISHVKLTPLTLPTGLDCANMIHLPHLDQILNSFGKLFRIAIACRHSYQKPLIGHDIKQCQRSEFPVGVHEITFLGSELRSL